MSLLKKILITGGAGFIGSHVVRLFVNKYPDCEIVNLDKLTYAGNLENLRDIENKQNYRFIKGDIVDTPAMLKLFSEEKFDGVVHLAAESHVDRSLENPNEFVMTNIIGTVNLLQAALKTWGADSSKRFYHISTDEVYGSAEGSDLFTEQTAIDPQSPYSSSKAGSDHFVKAFYNSFNLPILISRCSNNYGPNHFPEKLIPLMINNLLESKPLPVYGKGENVRDWLYVADHARAIDIIFHKGKTGEVYNVGGNNEWRNIDLVNLLCRVMDKKLQRPEGASAKLITYVKDRPGHDLRYAVDSSKLQNDLGWAPSVTLEIGLEKTVDWYLNNKEWLSRVTSGQYRAYYTQMYEKR
ncbi:MAG: dTDP-glucose 4,6-dehydratase [Cyclobacteriaceae bacterium]|nr:dTDP-glucose 4,6-dehydratase [Cyclobacteriaceae bacterium]